MADVLLTHSYHLYYDRKQARKMQPYPPLGTLYAAALLEQSGFSVAVFDTMLRDPGEFADFARHHRPQIVAVCEDNFNFLSKMCLTRMREVAFDMAATARMLGAVTLVNGSDATDHLAEYLNAGFDAALIGEVELTLLDVVRAIMSGREFRQVEGTAWLAAPGQIRRSLPRRLMKDLDALPMPARHLIDLQPYRRAWTAVHGRWSLNLVASRGCPFRCNWCAKPIYGNSFHLRAAASVAEEMRRLKLEHGVQHLWFADDIFALRPSWAEELANEVEIRDAALPFKIQTRADLVTPRFARALARAGCEEVWMGAESGSQKILNAMEKDTRVEHIEEARAHLAAENIGACFFIQFGYPEENWDDIGKTIDLVRRTRPDDIGISVSYPLPGTRFYERVRAQMGAKRNWSDSEDLAVMFRASYNNDFYRALREALHAEVDQWARPAFRSDRERVSATAMAELWATVERLEKTCRNQNPTVLPILTPQYFSSASAD